MTNSLFFFNVFLGQHAKRLNKEFSSTSLFSMIEEAPEFTIIGTEKLALVINRFFGGMIDLISKHGGDVIKVKRKEKTTYFHYLTFISVIHM